MGDDMSVASGPNKKPIRIGFSVSKGIMSILSRLICWMTNGVAGHTWLLVEEGGVDVVYEAAWVGFRAISFAEWQLDNTMIELYDPGVPLDSQMHRIYQTLGKPYAYEALEGMGIVMVARRWLHRTINNPFKDKGALFCSEVIADVLQGVDYPNSKQLKDYNTNPMDVRNVLIVAGAKKLYPAGSAAKLRLV